MDLEVNTTFSRFWEPSSRVDNSVRNYGVVCKSNAKNLLKSLVYAVCYSQSHECNLHKPSSV